MSEGHEPKLSPEQRLSQLRRTQRTQQEVLVKDHNKTQLASIIVASRIAHAERDIVQHDMTEALEWVVKIADANLEQDPKLRATGARTLRRIADRAESALAQARGES